MSIYFLSMKHYEITIKKFKASFPFSHPFFANQNRLIWFVRCISILINYVIDYVHSTGYLTKYNMLAIQPSCLCNGNEKLGSVGVWARVSHGENSGSSMGKLEILVLKLVSVDRSATSSISSCEVSSL